MIAPWGGRLMSNEEKRDQQMRSRILTDEEFLAMVANRGNPAELNQAMLDLRREGRIQLFDDGSGDPLVIKTERAN
jgi:hypothetical protein